jgi:hypothetical protein
MGITPAWQLFWQWQWEPRLSVSAPLPSNVCATDVMGWEERAIFRPDPGRRGGYSLRICLMRAIASSTARSGADALGGDPVDGFSPAPPPPRPFCQTLEQGGRG